jgi:lipopolysaccharide transport system permease protein
VTTLTNTRHLSDENWTLEITPHGDLIHIPVRDIWTYRDLLWLFVRRDFVSFYKQTILGPLWFFIQPLFTTLIFTLVFGKIGGFAPVAPEGFNAVPQVLFFLCSVTFWNYFSECLNKTATTFKDNANLFGKVYFPRLIVPLSIVISNLIKFGLQFLLFIFIFAFYYREGWDAQDASGVWGQFTLQPSHLLLFPIVVVIMGMLGLGLGMLFSAMTTKYRDLVFLLQFGVTLLMYGSAVIFSWSFLTTNYKVAEPYLAWNPLVPLIETVRSVFLGTTNVFSLVYPAVFAAAVLVFACIIFNRVEKTFMDTV